jgi:SAM-dependent methyltransferase
VGCGEGRVARALKELGHVVVGVESSPALARAATEGDPALEVHVADAAAMPLPDGLADLAVASLSLMNMDDMPGVVSEVARVLRPEGRLCFSILHPINSWGDAEAGYFETVRYHEHLDRGGARMILHDTHRPLGDYFGALEDASFLVERVVEPVPDAAYIAAFPEAARWLERPGFLHVRALLGR